VGRIGKGHHQLSKLGKARMMLLQGPRMRTLGVTALGALGSQAAGTGTTAHMRGIRPLRVERLDH